MLARLRHTTRVHCTSSVALLHILSTVQIKLLLVSLSTDSPNNMIHVNYRSLLQFLLFFSNDALQQTFSTNSTSANIYLFIFALLLTQFCVTTVSSFIIVGGRFLQYFVIFRRVSSYFAVFLHILPSFGCLRGQNLVMKRLIACTHEPIHLHFHAAAREQQPLGAACCQRGRQDCRRGRLGAITCECAVRV